MQLAQSTKVHEVLLLIVAAVVSIRKLPWRVALPAPVSLLAVLPLTRNRSSALAARIRLPDAATAVLPV